MAQNIYIYIYIYTHIHTHLIQGAESFFRSWPVNFAASQEIPRICGTRKFLTVPTSARHHPSLSWANSIQSPRAPPTSWRSILILSSHLRLGLHNGLFPSGFTTNTLSTPLHSPIRATRPAHLIRLDFTTRTILGMEYTSFISSLCSFLHSSVTSSLLGPNNLLNTLSLCSSLNVSDQVSHPYKPTGKIIVLYILIFDRLCSLVIRVSGYRYRGLGFDSRRYQIFWVVVGLERGPLSLVRSTEELLE